MKQSLIFCLAILFFQTSAVAQFSLPLKPWAQTLEKRTIVMEISTPNERKVKKLKKKGKTEELDEYLGGIERFNNDIRTLIPKYWPFENEIEFKSWEEIKQIVEKKNDKYAILEPSWSSEGVYTSRGIATYSCHTLKLYFPEFGSNLFYNSPVDDIRADGGTMRKGLYLFKISMPDYTLRERRLRFVMSQFKEFIDLGMTKGKPEIKSKRVYNIGDLDHKYMSRIKTKTLLIPAELLTMKEEQLSDKYPYKYEIVPADEIDTLLYEDQTGKYIYYDIVWSDEHRAWGLFLIDNGTGDLLAENSTLNKEVAVNWFGLSDIHMVINQKHIQNLLDWSEHE